MRNTLVATMALPALASWLAAPALGQNVSKIAITPQSQKAAIIIRSPVVQPPPLHKTSYRLIFRAYDPVAEQLKGGPFGGSEVIAPQPKHFVNGFLAINVEPGTYVVTGFNRQDYWSLCYYADSVQFTVKPGEVLYLGYFDARKALDELNMKVVTSGRMSTRGGPVQFFDTVAAPPFLPINEQGLQGARAMAKAAMPRTTVEPKAATLTPARFGTGTSLVGERLCGGYFAEKAADTKK
ncbi:MAG: hypothetical protein J7494_11860 [Sphingobium sp.]|nr:hypothetical protein [Sphingobium sp.]